MNNILLEEKAIHIYKDDSTGNMYYFDGTKLVSLGKDKNTAQIGDKGDEEEQAAQQAWHDAEVEKDRAENPTEEESEEERQARLDRINNFFDDEENQNEVTAEAEAAKEKEKARLKRIKPSTESKYYTAGDLGKFSLDLSKFIADQVKKIRKKSWKVANQKYEGSGIMRRGKHRVDNKNIPVINVYFDQSGSWGERDVDRGKQAIGVLNEYEEDGKIKINVFYFANNIHTNASAARSEGGTGAGKELIDHIQATKPTNVIVMTDDDFDSWPEIREAGKALVPGAVWLLFRRYESKELQKHLQGRSQNKKYFI